MEIKSSDARGGLSAKALLLLIESEAKLYDVDLTRFLHANRIPRRSKTL
ncbi:MAG TPA: hypothetical protein PLX43_00200 [Nitrobacter sp.]|nr:hypothetical protein [Nitrobacter sp.]